jgi:hypothetical protein
MITICFPEIDPNSGPATAHTFSWQCAFRYTLPTSVTRIPRLFNAATVTAILILSCDTTDHDVSRAGVLLSKVPQSQIRTSR